MSWNKVCPQKTWLSRLHHEVMNIGRSEEATVILPRNELPLPSFDIAKSSTASWLQCTFNQCPVGRCLPAPESRLVPDTRKRKRRLMICAKKVWEVLLLPRWHNKRHCPVTSSNLWKDSEQPEFCQRPFCRLLRGLFDFWLLVWGVASCPFRAADCRADVSRRTWSAWEIWSSTIRRSKRGVNYSLVNCAGSKIVSCIYHCLACIDIDVLFGLWLLIS